MKKSVNGIIVDMTADEIAARQAEETAWNNGAFDRAMVDLRNIRDAKLAETDYIITKHTEAGTAIPTEWKTYRTALRDITNNLTTVDDVNGVTWPTKPSE